MRKQESQPQEEVALPLFFLSCLLRKFGQIIVATGSMRKAIITEIFIRGLPHAMGEDEGGNLVRADSPDDLHRFFAHNIHNGNGVLLETATVFYDEKIGQVVAVPQRGEGGSNDCPITEARNKVCNIAAENSGDIGVIGPIIGMDVFYQVTLPGGEVFNLGKPMNDQNAPPEKFSGQEEADYQKQLAAYWQKYIDKYYPIGTSVRNLTAVAILDPITGKIYEILVPLEIEVSQEFRDGLHLEPDRAGGGIASQFLAACGGDVIPVIKDQILRDRIPDDLADRDVVAQEMAEWLLWAQIMGLPFLQIEQMLEQVWEERLLWWENYYKYSGQLNEIANMV